MIRAGPKKLYDTMFEARVLTFRDSLQPHISQFFSPTDRRSKVRAFESNTMSFSLLKWLKAPTQPPFVLLLDGGVSTFLEHVLAASGKVFSHRSLWSSSLLLDGNKEDVQNMHRAFQKAGADILSTVTYQCHFAGTEVDDERMTQMLRDGVSWAKEEAGGTSFVAASSGCYGSALADGSEYTGDYGGVTQEQLMDFHRRKFKVLSEESPDTIAIETIPNLLECRAVVAMLKEQENPIACWMSLACQDGDRLNDGSKFEDALDAIHELDPNVDYVHGIGINCCDTLHGM